MKKKLLSSALLLVTAIVWGFAFVAQVKGMESVGTYTYNGLRFLIGSAVMLPLFLIFSKDKGDKKKFRSSMLYGVPAGLLLFTASTLQQYAIELSPDANSMKAGFITGLYTVAVPVIGFVFMKKKTAVTTWIGSVAALAGLYLLCAAGESGFDFTDGMLLLSVSVWACHILFIDRFGHGSDAFVLSGIQYAVCGGLSLICAVFFDAGSLNAQAIGGALLPILYGGIMSVGVGFTLQTVGQKGADPTVAAIIMSTESMFGAIGNLLLLSVSMSPLQYVGCVLMFAGIVISQLPAKGRKKAETIDS